MPKLVKVDDYLDWRRVHDDPARASLDFEPADALVDAAWRDVLTYLEDRWQRHLL